MNSLASNGSRNPVITPAKLARLKEVLLTTLLGDLATIALGVHLRKLLYPQIFGRFGKFICIETGVKFYGTSNIQIGDRVKICSGVRLNSLGVENNRITLGSGVTLELKTGYWVSAEK